MDYCCVCMGYWFFDFLVVVLVCFLVRFAFCADCLCLDFWACGFGCWVVGWFRGWLC